MKLNKQQNTQYKQKQTLIDLAAVVTVVAVVEGSEDFGGPPDHQGELVGESAVVVVEVSEAESWEG